MQNENTAYFRKSGASDVKETSRLLSICLARYFFRHLNEELSKSEDLLNSITSEGVTFRRITEEMIKDLLIEFPQLKTANEAPFNFMRLWMENNLSDKTYDKSTYKLYNQSVFSRLLDLRDQSVRSRVRLRKRINTTLKSLKFFGKEFTFGIFFRAETTMREIFREILENELKISYNTAWKIITDQSDFWLECGYKYYDGLLRNALDRSDTLLKNIFPEKIANELIERGFSEPVFIKSATVLFTDFKGFTKIAESLSPTELVAELDRCFTYFDNVVERYNLEKIKTIGDSYMCVGGVPKINSTHCVDAILASLEIQTFMNQMKSIAEDLGKPYWELRLGIHTGPLIAGVIGEKRFAYDIWGDTVNTASRLESSGETGRINISRDVRDKVRELFDIEFRGEIPVKNKGNVEMYYVNGILPDLTDNDRRVPNEHFWQLYNQLSDK